MHTLVHHPRRGSLPLALALARILAPWAFVCSPPCLLHHLDAHMPPPPPSRSRSRIRPHLGHSSTRMLLLLYHHGPRPPSLLVVRNCIAAGPPPRRARAPTLPQAPDPIALPAPPLPSAHYHISSHLSHTHLSVVQPPLLVSLARVHRAPVGSGISGSHQDGPLLVYHLSVPHHHPYVHPGPSPPPSAPAAPCLSFRPSVHPCVCALRPLVRPVHIWPPVPSLHPPARYQHIIIGVRGACTPVRRRSSLRLREPYRIHSFRVRSALIVDTGVRQGSKHVRARTMWPAHSK